jgi:hypothetical protein
LLNIGTDKGGDQVDTEDLTGLNAGDGTTGANTVDTGTFFVSEVPNPITNYFDHPRVHQHGRWRRRRAG